MPAKPEAAAPEAKQAAPAAAAEAASPEAKQGESPSLIASLLPAIIVVVLTPVLTWAVAEFVLIKRLEKRLASVASAQVEPSAKPAAAEASEGGGEAKEPKKGEPGASANTYEFSNVVVNLAGTMGTRYLKATFLVTGSDPTLHSVFEGNKPKLTDVTLNILSSLTLPDLEEAGAKNVIREKLVAAYNQALGKRVAEQVYFSDFVVQ